MIISHRDEMEQKLHDLLREYPKMGILFQYLIEKRRDRDLLNKNHHRGLADRELDNLAKSDRFNNELREKALIFSGGFHDKGKSVKVCADCGSSMTLEDYLDSVVDLSDLGMTKSCLTKKTQCSWFTYGQEYRAELEKITGQKHDDIEAMTDRVIAVIVVDNTSVNWENLNHPSRRYGD